MDSDRRTKGAQLNSTKLRILNELKAIGGMSWVTDGREIESYYEPDQIRSAINGIMNYEVHSIQEPDRYGRPLRHYKLTGRRRGALVEGVDKIKLAKRLTSNSTDLSRYGLAKRVGQLVDFIREHNR